MTEPWQYVLLVLLSIWVVLLVSSAIGRRTEGFGDSPAPPYTKFVDPTPRVLRCLSGRWLAVSAYGESIHIGVDGSSEQEVRLRFSEAVAAWELLWADDTRTDFRSPQQASREPC